MTIVDVAWIGARFMVALGLGAAVVAAAALLIVSVEIWLEGRGGAR